MNPIFQSLHALKHRLEARHTISFHRSSAIHTLNINGFVREALELQNCGEDRQQILQIVERLIQELPNTSMIQTSGDENTGCGILLLLVFGLPTMLVWVAELASELTGVDFGTAFSWEIGIMATAVAVWMILWNPLMRFILVVIATAIGMMVLLLCFNGNDREALDTLFSKTMVISVSTAVGALYLAWEVKRNPTDWS